MNRMSRKRAFAEYGAVLNNVMYSVSAINPAGELIVSLWGKYLKPHNGALRYRDKLTRFSGNGREELRKHLVQAVTQKLPVRAVVARVLKDKDWARIDAGEDASNIPKTFRPRPDFGSGRIVEFDGDTLVIDFQLTSEHRQE
jgi:hypothetical protein